VADRLYHYTCADHGRPGIDRDGVLRPNSHPWLATPLVWLTDLDQPWREALGLTSNLLSCDRAAVRYTADPSGCVRWTVWARRLPRDLREVFESAPGVLPGHWWVSERPLPVRVLTAGGAP
jgi:hypothetical protein